VAWPRPCEKTAGAHHDHPRGHARAPAKQALALTFPFEFGGIRYICTVGRYPDGRLAEVFIGGPKTNSGADVAARDASILVSLLLQHNCDPKIIAHAMSRNSDGTASGVIGVALDLIAGKEGMR
jgi:hypothetical protein